MSWQEQGSISQSCLLLVSSPTDGGSRQAILFLAFGFCSRQRGHSPPNGWPDLGLLKPQWATFILGQMSYVFSHRVLSDRRGAASEVITAPTAVTNSALHTWVGAGLQLRYLWPQQNRQLEGNVLSVAPYLCGRSLWPQHLWPVSLPWALCAFSHK